MVDRREFPVLYVDDEKENLRAFELAFRREYTIHTATSGSEALDVVNNHPVAVVLSDHRMPGMTGTEFLARVRAVDPRTVRLLVTAYGDAATLADAVNNGAIYRYMPKPWDLEEMRQALAQAVDLYSLAGEREFLLGELTALQSVSHRLASELEPARISQLTTEAVVEDLGFDAAALLLKGPAGFRVASSTPAEGAAFQFLADLVIEKNEAAPWFKGLLGGKSQLLTADGAKEEGELAHRLLTEIAAEEVLCVPVASARGVLGFLLADNRRGGRRFLASERLLLEGLGAQVATALGSSVQALDALHPDPRCSLPLVGAVTLGVESLEGLPESISSALAKLRSNEGGAASSLASVARLVEQVATRLEGTFGGRRPRISTHEISGKSMEGSAIFLALGLLMAELSVERELDLELRGSEGLLTLEVAAGTDLLDDLAESVRVAAAAEILGSRGFDLTLEESDGLVRVSLPVATS